MARPFSDLRSVSNTTAPSSSSRNQTGVTNGEPSLRTTDNFAVRVPLEQNAVTSLSLSERMPRRYLGGDPEPPIATTVSSDVTKRECEGRTGSWT